MDAMPIPLWIGFDFNEDSLALMIVSFSFKSLYAVFIEPLLYISMPMDNP